MRQPTFYAHPQHAPAQPTMADVWASYPIANGTLAAAVQDQVQQHAPLVPVHVAAPGTEPTMRPRPYRDPIEWLLLKHLVQAAFIAAVVVFVVQGGSAPLMSLGYVGVTTIADRLRFADRDPAFEIIEIIAPQPALMPMREPRPAPLAPLVEQMQVVMPEAVSVT
jgi:hypothetical protein